MSDGPAKPVLLTGASGKLGRHLAAALGGMGWPLRLTDIAPFPDPLPPGADFTPLDLRDGGAFARLAEGCGTILHFAGVARERLFEEVLDTNLRGLHAVYDAARLVRARVVYASSGHAFGFHQCSAPLDADAAFLPDSFYGLSKAYGELMGQLYWHKHRVENVNLRIGTCGPEPKEALALATWLSPADLTRLCVRAVLAEAVGSCAIWGVSDNSRSFWREDARSVIGWAPEDSADSYAEALAGRAGGNPIADRYQGGWFTVMGYSRRDPPPDEPAG